MARMANTAAVVIGVILTSGAVFSQEGRPGSPPRFDPGQPAPASALQPLPAPAEFDQLFAELNSEHYEARQAAEARLISLGPSASEDLVARMKNATPEQQVRSVRALGAWYGHSSFSDMAMIDDALENETARVTGAARDAIRTVFVTYARQREDLSIQRLMALSGQMNEIPRNDFQARSEDGDPRTRRYVFIGRHWKGGDEGLKLIARIPRIDMVYYSESSGVTLDGLNDLQALMPNLPPIQLRSDAYLGVSAALTGNPMIVGKVTAGSAADKAGIQTDDVIEAFDGEPITGFDQLIRKIRDYDPGDVVEIKVKRGFATLTLKTELTGWK